MTIISKLIAFENNSLQAKFAKNLKIDKLTISGSNLPQINPSEVLIINTITFLFEKLYDISTDLNVETKKKISKTTFSIYNCLTTPSITIEDYLKRIQTFMKLNDEFYLLCLIYIDKLSQKTSLLITSLNIHKLLLTSLTLACKYLDDDWESNEFMAKLGGIPLAELNSMEMSFLKDINYELFIDNQTLVFYQRHMKDYFSRFVKITRPNKTS